MKAEWLTVIEEAACQAEEAISRGTCPYPDVSAVYERAARLMVDDIVRGCAQRVVKSYIADLIAKQIEAERGL